MPNIIVKPQFKFLYTDKTPNLAIVCCRGGGKTYSVTDWLVQEMLKPENVWMSAIFFSPTLKQCKSTVAPIMRRHQENLNDRLIFNKSDLLYTFKKSETDLRELRLLSYENQDTKRGVHPDIIILDEVSDCPASMFDLVIVPMMVSAIESGRARIIAIGTPQGRNAFYDLYQKGKSLEFPNWNSYTLKASNSELFSKKTLWEIRQTMTVAGYAQEMECDFNANVILGTVFGEFIENFTEKLGNIDDTFAYNASMPVFTAWDLGHSNNTSIWFFQVKNDVVTFIDFYENSGMDISHYAGVLLAKPYTYAKAVLPWDAGVKNIRSPLCIADQLNNFGIRSEVLGNSSVSAGIDAARQLLKTCRFNKTKCFEGLEHLKLYHFKFNEKLGVTEQKPVHDRHSDASDAFRYAAVGKNIYNLMQNEAIIVNNGYVYNVFNNN